MRELNLHYEYPYKPEIRDVTLALFYAINTSCEGNMIYQLDLKFFDTMPYVDLNVYKMKDNLRNFWKEFCLYVSSLCDREADLELLDEQYPHIYQDALSICKDEYPTITIDPYSQMISSNRTINYNIQQLRICRDCIKHCFTQINKHLKGIKDAILEVRRTPKAMRRIATVCKVDNLITPWECYTKIARLRNLNITPHKEVEYEQINKVLMEEKLKKQNEKFNKLYSNKKQTKHKDKDDIKETDKLFDKIGYQFRKLPSLAISKQGYNSNNQNKREILNSQKTRINEKSRTLSIEIPDSGMKFVKYEDTRSSRENSPQNRMNNGKNNINKDFEDIGLMKAPVRSPQSRSRKLGKKTLMKKPGSKAKNLQKNFDIFSPLQIFNNQHSQVPTPQAKINEKQINYAPNSYNEMKSLQINQPTLSGPQLTPFANLNIYNNNNKSRLTPYTPLSSMNIGNINTQLQSQTPLGMRKRINSDNKLKDSSNNNLSMQIIPQNQQTARQNRQVEGNIEADPQKNLNADYVSFDF